MESESYDEGWNWTRARVADGMTAFVIPANAVGAAQEVNDPDAFYEGAMDSLAAMGGMYRGR